MARYIDADRLWHCRPQLKKLNDPRYTAGFNECMAGFSEIIGKLIDNQPTADVVPKSEVDFLRETIAENAQKALEVTLEEIEKAKTEVAREIFEEIEKHILENCCVTDDDVDGIWKHIAELKKKYTEGET